MALAVGSSCAASWLGSNPGWPSAAEMSQACTAASRAQAAAAAGAGNGPCGSGVGTAPLSLWIPAHAVRATVSAGSMRSATRPSRRPEGMPGADGGRALRHRYLALFLQALRAPGAGPLPGHAADPAELAARWHGN
jgi:hypothetical protein